MVWVLIWDLGHKSKFSPQKHNILVIKLKNFFSSHNFHSRKFRNCVLILYYTYLSSTFLSIAPNNHRQCRYHRLALNNITIVVTSTCIFDRGGVLSLRQANWKAALESKLEIFCFCMASTPLLTNNFLYKSDDTGFIYMSLVLGLQVYLTVFCFIVCQCSYNLLVNCGRLV